jgi:hypothetical protein
MMVIYHDVGGAHSSCVCANIHINKLPIDKVPAKEEILSLPTFDKISKTEYGQLIYIGTDEFGAEVYTLCRMRSKQFVIPAIADMYKILNGSMEGFFLADTSPTVTNLLRFGGISSRVLGLTSLGRPIAAKGVLKGYENMVTLVQKTKAYMKSHIK